eukprot:TRINITY_DN2275_c0_g1_i1.p2 TRINITY_DN2275_c0_g1~~TRINITY_DN2275_c0_g1_i1.p2  ORF type:complete len:417 (-),score=139.32 TRINITY_DN2275_c0_g1_i1:107-1357(-)
MAEEEMMQGDDGPSLGPSSMAPSSVVPQLGGVDDATMEDVIDKLKLLNYEHRFCVAKTFRPLHRCFFAMPHPNPNEQFYYFTSLVSWVMELCGHHYPPPDQFDDPNATATSIITELKAMDFSVKDIAPGKIRQGNGPAVLHVLTILLDKAMIVQNVSVRSPEFPPDNYHDELDVDDGVPADDIQDEVLSEDEGVEEFWDGNRDREGGDSAEHPSVIETHVDPEEWRMELERVTPLLKINRRADHKDWRSHLDWIQSLIKTMDKTFPEAKLQLEKISEDITKAIEKIQKREQTLTQQFETYVEQYRTQKKDYNAIAENYKQTSDTVNTLSTELNQITEMLETAKAEISRREEQMSDTTPLVKIKEALSKIKLEVKQMELRIGVLQHSLLHYKMKGALHPANRDQPHQPESNHGLDVN